jgi:hypothetical protein
MAARNSRPRVADPPDRGVAQSGSALALGARGPQFESGRPDQSLDKLQDCWQDSWKFPTYCGQAFPQGVAFITSRRDQHHSFIRHVPLDYTRFIWVGEQNLNVNGIVLWSVYVSGKKELGLIRPFRLSHRLRRLMGLHTELRT